MYQAAAGRPGAQRKGVQQRLSYLPRPPDKSPLRSLDKPPARGDSDRRDIDRPRPLASLRTANGLQPLRSGTTARRRTLGERANAAVESRLVAHGGGVRKGVRRGCALARVHHFGSAERVGAKLSRSDRERGVLVNTRVGIGVLCGTVCGASDRCVSLVRTGRCIRVEDDVAASAVSRLIPCQGTPTFTGLVNPNPYGFTAAMVGGERPPCTGDVR